MPDYKVLLLPVTKPGCLTRMLSMAILSDGMHEMVPTPSRK
jgi:hypothetical protein